jgi:hypothetical protein
MKPCTLIIGALFAAVVGATVLFGHNASSAGDPAGKCVSYVNSNGNQVPRPCGNWRSDAKKPPSGATARCQDGSWSWSQHPLCARHLLASRRSGELRRARKGLDRRYSAITQVCSKSRSHSATCRSSSASSRAPRRHSIEVEVPTPATRLQQQVAALRSKPPTLAREAWDSAPDRGVPMQPCRRPAPGMFARISTFV